MSHYWWAGQPPSDSWGETSQERVARAETVGSGGRAPPSLGPGRTPPVSCVRCPLAAFPRGALLMGTPLARPQTDHKQTTEQGSSRRSCAQHGAMEMCSDLRLRPLTREEALTVPAFGTQGRDHRRRPSTAIATGGARQLPTLLLGRCVVLLSPSGAPLASAPCELGPLRQQVALRVIGRNHRTAPPVTSRLRHQRRPPAEAVVSEDASHPRPPASRASPIGTLGMARPVESARPFGTRAPPTWRTSPVRTRLVFNVVGRDMTSLL